MLALKQGEKWNLCLSINFKPLFLSIHSNATGSDAEITLHLGELESVFQKDHDEIETPLPRHLDQEKGECCILLQQKEMLEKGRRGCNYKRWNLAKIQHVICSVLQKALQYL